ncbi:MAG: GIY-YIG nuclease family protein [Ignavibacteriaceae bacterium]|nr:GIY-YIG nuclease family protein [Ignavibacteria bacterium]NNL22652.1 GIY-YIG nuclease family protein [Ignavibacteriaceae bacterium]
MTFFYTYVLQSLKDYNFYYGYTNDLKSRIDRHKLLI